MALNDAQKYIIKSFIEFDIFDALTNCTRPVFAFEQVFAEAGQLDMASLTELGIDQEITLARRLMDPDENPQDYLNLASRANPDQPEATAAETTAYIKDLLTEQQDNLPQITPPDAIAAEAEIPPLEFPDFTPEIGPEQMEDFVLFLSCVFLNRPIDLTEEATSWLLFALRHEREEFRESALHAVRFCPGEKITMPLRRGILHALRYDADDRVRAAAAEALTGLVRLGSDAMQLVINALYHQMEKDAYLTVRIAAAETLYRHGDRNEAIVKCILDGLKFPGLGQPHQRGANLVRARAAKALGRIGAMSSYITSALHDAARHDSFSNVRIAANAALARLGVSRENAMHSLTHLATGRYDNDLARREIVELVSDEPASLVRDVDTARDLELRTLQERLSELAVRNMLLEEQLQQQEASPVREDINVRQMGRGVYTQQPQPRATRERPASEQRSGSSCLVM